MVTRSIKEHQMAAMVREMGDNRMSHCLCGIKALCFTFMMQISYGIDNDTT